MENRYFCVMREALRQNYYGRYIALPLQRPGVCRIVQKNLRVFSFMDTNMIQLPGKVIVGIFGLNKGRPGKYYR